MALTSMPNQPAKGWKTLAPLPDPIGYAGMVAGVLDGRLVVTGGTQWSHPLWLKGTRKFNDEIFVLDSIEGSWCRARAHLTEPCGHFATATTADAIYFAGGTDPKGCRTAVYELRAAGDDYVFRRLPDLPKPTGYAAGAIASGRFFVLGGVADPASTSPSREVWSLDLKKPDAGWTRETDLPGLGLLVSSGGSDGDSLFVFGGMTFVEGKPVPSTTAYRMDQPGGSWERLPDIPEPRVGINSPCPVLADGAIWLVGGYATVWPGAQRDHPGFAAETFRYQPSTRTWSHGPSLPNVGAGDRDAPGDAGPVPPIGAPVVVWKNHVIVIGGEVRISTRTPAVIAWPLTP
ncbi:MAG: hypothetical protein JSS11_08740 [Verrucomicrobia bacterium]|nr:hypothetical protein [Verrucomicrobiota bacterium]